MKTHWIQAQAPTRLDLAGGTLDLWPLYLYLKTPLTVNWAIDLYARVQLSTIQTSLKGARASVLVTLQDGSDSWEWFWEQTATKVPKKFRLAYEMLNWIAHQRRVNGFSLKLPWNLKLSTHTQSPAGAGLGGSSALALAILGVLWTLKDQAYEDDTPLRPWKPQPEEKALCLKVVQDLETRLLGIPAGQQDYLSALEGGLQVIQWEVGGLIATQLPHPLSLELHRRVILIDSGESRNSGINNWAIFKKCLDRQEKIPQKLQLIAEIAHQLSLSLKNQKWREVGQWIAEEWRIRKRLSHQVSTARLDQAFQIAKRIAGGVGKVCGAGGGGCFFLYFPEAWEGKAGAVARQRLMTRLHQEGYQELAYRWAPKGLTISGG